MHKKLYLFLTLVICAILGTSYYLEIHDGIMPCPLCTLQRGSFALLAFTFFLGIFLSRVAILRRIIPLLGILFSIVGGLLAGRQVYLQMFSQGDHESCGVSLEYMVKVLPLQEVMQKVFAGSAECTQKTFELFTLSMPQWALILFVGFGVTSVYLLFSKRD